MADLIENTGRAEAIGRAGQAFLHRIDPERAMRRIETLLSGDEAPDWDEHREARAELAAAAEPRECALAR
ncbi:MAG: hypothetical protein HY718_03740 [Planctomycetes bacterium]|nr:hypothetical protein [Planctomycetota bacterium]